MNESFKTDPSLATSARAAKESGSYLCASNVTPTAVRFIVSVFLCLLCSCRMPSTQMTCSHFRKNRPKKRLKPAGCRSRIISKNRPVPIFGRSTGASLVFWPQQHTLEQSVHSSPQPLLAQALRSMCVYSGVPLQHNRSNEKQSARTTVNETVFWQNVAHQIKWFQMNKSSTGQEVTCLGSPGNSREANTHTANASAHKGAPASS